MKVPHAPGDRPAPESQSSKQDIHVIYDNQQHGPFGVWGICVLIRAGKVPKDAIYWREGMIGTRPISDFADEVQVTMPRNHHYHFAYTTLPVALFTAPKFVHRILAGEAQSQVGWAWNLAERIYAKGDVVPSTGLNAELLAYDHKHTLFFVTLPTPRRNAEAYFAAAVIPRPNFFGRVTSAIRYFVLSHSNADEMADHAEGCIREITADRANLRTRDFIEPSKNAFITVISELISTAPNG